MNTNISLGDALEKLDKQFPNQLLIISSKDELNRAFSSKNYNILNGESHVFKNNDIQIIEKIGEALAAGRQASITNQINDKVEVRIAKPGEVLFGESKKSSSCFVATAVYGSPLAPEVIVFRRFRDEVLLKSRLGTTFTKIYYIASPPFASLISKTNFLKGLVRSLVLSPLLRLLKRNFRF